MYVLERKKNKRTFTILVYKIEGDVKTKVKSFGRVELQNDKDYNDIEISKYYYKYVDELNDSVPDSVPRIPITGSILINLALSYLGFNRKSFPYHYFRIYLKQSLNSTPGFGQNNDIYKTRRIYKKEFDLDFKLLSNYSDFILKKFNKKYYSEGFNPLSDLDIYYEFYRDEFNNDNAYRTTIILDQNNILYDAKIEELKKATSEELLKTPDHVVGKLDKTFNVSYFANHDIEWKISEDMYELYDKYSLKGMAPRINTRFMLRSLIDKIVWVLYKNIFNKAIPIEDIKLFITNVDIYYWYGLYHNTSYEASYFTEITNYLNLSFLQERFLTTGEALRVSSLKEIELVDGRRIHILIPLSEI